MATPPEESPIRFTCLFCNESIEPGALDPCGLSIIGGFDRPHSEQKEQTFYCHIACLKSHSSDHPSIQGSFYITDPEFPTLGEIESES